MRYCVFRLITALAILLFMQGPVGRVAAQRASERSSADWARIIDAHWGSGSSTQEKLRIFDLAWTILDEEYGAFQNIDVDMETLKGRYRPEIEGGVSRGRFAAIMNYMSLAMKSAHTTLKDRGVNRQTLRPGVPLFVIGAFRSNAHFGASLTPLPDSTLLVYRSTPGHVLGLERGDLVLGYEGVLWKDLFRRLIHAELPIKTTWVWGSTDASIEHQILASLGMNWHLFETIDIVKYATGDTLHLSTAPLVNQRSPVWGNEQLEVPGVPMPRLASDEFVTWGMVAGTRIGYVYVASMDHDPAAQISSRFLSAVQELAFDQESEGLIIDYRLNYGGGLEASEAYSLLFDQNTYTIAYDWRDPGEDHFAMRPAGYGTAEQLRIMADADTYYDKPIAILNGPATVSAGDVESWRISFHPRARFFGKPGSGAMSISRYPDLGNSDWFFYLSTGGAYLVDDHTQYLAHRPVEIDEKVWLTQEDVANGVDTVVEAAISWIKSEAVDTERPTEIPEGTSELNGAFPSPFESETTISYRLTASGHMELKVYNLLGQQVEILHDGYKPKGEYSVSWNASELPSGVYLIRLLVDGAGIDMHTVVKSH